MSKRLSILWLILPLLLASCSEEVWHKNIKNEDFAPLDTILFIALLAGIVILLGYFLLSKCIIPYSHLLVAEVIISGSGSRII